MVARTRAAESEGKGPRTRSKVAKTTKRTPKEELAKTTKRARENIHDKKRLKKGANNSSTFKSNALPLHVNITHTPPVVGGDETRDVAQIDPGFIGSATLVPSSPDNGSCGWKGGKRVTIDLQNRTGGQREQVDVMFTFQATVLKTKRSKDEESEGDGEGALEDEETAEGSESASSHDEEQIDALL